MKKQLLCLCALLVNNVYAAHLVDVTVGNGTNYTINAKITACNDAPLAEFKIPRFMIVELHHDNIDPGKCVKLTLRDADMSDFYVAAVSPHVRASVKYENGQYKVELYS